MRGPKPHVPNSMQQRLLEIIAERKQQAAQAQAEYEQAIRDAYAVGCTSSEMSRAANTSATQIYRILKRKEHDE